MVNCCCPLEIPCAQISIHIMLSWRDPTAARETYLLCSYPVQGQHSKLVCSNHKLNWNLTRCGMYEPRNSPATTLFWYSGS